MWPPGSRLAKPDLVCYELVCVKLIQIVEPWFIYYVCPKVKSRKTPSMPFFLQQSWLWFYWFYSALMWYPVFESILKSLRVTETLKSSGLFALLWRLPLLLLSQAAEQPAWVRQPTLTRRNVHPRDKFGQLQIERRGVEVGVGELRAIFIFHSVRAKVEGDADLSSSPLSQVHWRSFWRIHAAT